MLQNLIVLHFIFDIINYIIKFRGFYLKKNWDLEELIESFTFMSNELDLLKDKTKETQLGFAVLFKFFNIKRGFQVIKRKFLKI